MVIRQIQKKLSVLLTINEPEEIAEGVFKTTLTHPKLKGELSFVHSEAVGRDEILKALDENIVGHVLDLVNVVGGILNGQPDATKSTRAATGTGPGS